MNKTYVVDTNVIITNPRFYTEFEDATILIPIYVLEELDKLKTRDGNSGFRARQFFRNFKKIEKKGNLLGGIEIENKVILKSSLIEGKATLPENYDMSYADNKILIFMLEDENKGNILVTNDVSMRIKASSLGIECRSFDTSDKHKLEYMYSGVIEKKVDIDTVKKFHVDGGIDPSELGIDNPSPNEFFIGTTDYKYDKILARYSKKKEKFVKLRWQDSSIYGVKAKDDRQAFAVEALLDKNIPFVTITSRQGCGKTLLALSAALELVVSQGEYEKVIVGKNTSPIDKWSYQGFTTGDTEEKLITHFGNYTTTLENISAIRGSRGKNGLDILMALKEKNKLDVLDVSSILGSSFIDKIIILDEAQSFDVHAMRSIITRMGTNSKLILIGDIGQQTVSRVDPDKSGLYTAVEWLKGIEETAHITLSTVHRSTFVDLAGKIYDEKLFG